jgi:hypothetical protein
MRGAATESGGRCAVCGSSDLVEHRPGEIERLDQVSFSFSFSPEHNRTFRVVRCRACTHLFWIRSPTPSRRSTTTSSTRST